MVLPYCFIKMHEWIRIFSTKRLDRLDGSVDIAGKTQTVLCLYGILKRINGSRKRILGQRVTQRKKKVWPQIHLNVHVLIGEGRELYTAPRVFIGNQKCKVEEIEDRGRKKYVCRDQFYVSRIGYDDNRIINALEIKKRGGVVVFSTQRENDCKEETSNTNSEQHSLSEAQYNTVIGRLKKNHMTQKEIMQKYDVKSIYKLSQEQFKNFMDSTAGEEKQVPPPVTEEEMQKIIPPDDYSDLPI